MITPLPGATPLVPGSCTLPFPGIQFAVVDETGADLPWGQGGILVCKKPWPSMIRTIWGDPERFVKSYYPADFQGKYYLAGDGDPRQGHRLLHHHRPYRRRAERFRSPHGHDGNRIRAGCQPAGCRGCRCRPSG
jgi:hypothetical protein